ncbi:hypothetical protein BASA50_011162 [Batrachochytrium salamandrivorans]|uniref:Uncharacterized protein n=1 Tax=Batrachochytrium salamandrivorans TaxID=1357716 RepID=A0ABQ8EWM6_9FUNG|nr:hypothetical protein BASA50_011162 [Batrachochytrium salamandrivorans]
MLLSISLISIAMFNAVVNAQYDDYNSGYQQSRQYNQPGYQQWQQYSRPGYQRQPSYTPNTDASDECGKIADDYDMIPFNTWGKLTESMKTLWGQKGCDQQMCQYWAKKYNIKPLENAQCKAAAIKFRTYPIGIWGSMPNYAMPNYAIPNYAMPNYAMPNYAMPNYAKPLWTQGNCDIKMCEI